MTGRCPRGDELRGVPVTVMGLGSFGGGVAAVRWLLAQGARVTVTDLRREEGLRPALEALAGCAVSWSLGQHREQDFAGARWVVVNPAVRPDDPWVERARQAGAGITSEVELFLSRAPGPVVLVSGTQGKSSTTHFLASLLVHGGRAARAGGNIGRALLAEVERLAPEEVCVLEVSSYQLEHLGDPDPERRSPVRAAVITNLLPDHLERHGTLERYAAAKSRALAALGPGDAAWLPAELARAGAFRDALGPLVRVETWGGADSALAVEKGRFRWRGEELGALIDLRVPGAFQRDNVLVALAVARDLGVPAQRLREGVARLTGLPHRLQLLGELQGRRVLDNGVSTTPDSTLAALESLAGPVTLLLGGQRKRGLDFEPLARAAAARAARVVTFGASAGELRDRFAAAGCDARAVDLLDEAARTALSITEPGGDLLFSPACASFDAYLNFQERALHFRRALALA